MTVGSELVRFGRSLVGREESTTPRSGALIPDIERFGDPSFQAWADSWLRYQGSIYQPNSTTYAGQKVEPVQDSFVGYVQGAYKANGIIFAVSMARARPFSEISFKFRRKGQAGGGSDLFGNKNLDILDTPWPGGTTQDLIMRAEQDVTTAGTFFVVREDGMGGTPDRLRRLRPDWCEFILTAPPNEAVASDVVGVKYTAGGCRGGGPYKLYLLDEIAFWAPIPDPDALFRGMSWLTPVMEELQADKAATTHKLKFFENAATPNLSISLKESIGPEKFKQFVQQMNDSSVGIDQAYKTLYTGGGADVRVIGADMRQLDFAITQGHGETRVAAAGSVPPIIVGLSEGLQAATYSNYGQAKRAYGDIFLRSQWRSLCGALAPIIDVPSNANLWYDGKDVAFLREDNADLANTQGVQAATISSLIATGFTPESAVKAVLAEDFSILVHSGLVSVQLQPPGGPDPNAAPGADPNAPAADPNAMPEPDPAEAAQSDSALAGALDSIGA
jgi:hypothetical protein